MGDIRGIKTVIYSLDIKLTELKLMMVLGSGD